MANPTTPVDPRSTRLAHLGDETNARSLGQLCYVVAAISLVGTAEFAAFAAGRIACPPEWQKIAEPATIRLAFGAMTGVMAAHAAAQAAVGFGLVRLQAWARWTVIALTLLSLTSTFGLALAVLVVRPAWGLLAMVGGVGVHALILWPLLTSGAGVVFSTAYREVVRATPEIRCRMHWLLKLGLGLMGLTVVGFVVLLAAIYFRWVDW